MSKNMSDDIFDALTVAKRKLRMADLMYELNRLQFTSIADATLHYADKKTKNEFDISTAAEIILKHIPECFVKAKYILNSNELDAIYSFCIMCLVDEINPNFFMNSEQTEA